MSVALEVSPMEGAEQQPRAQIPPSPGVVANGVARERESKEAATSSWRMRFVVRLAIVPCPSCGTGVDTIKHTVAAGTPPAFWRPDTRKIPVCCPSCHQYFWAYAYSLFNWIPSRRVFIGIALLNLVAGLLVLSAIWR
jgi:hypothetical protein